MNLALLLIDIQNDYFEKGSMTLEGSDIACVNAKKILDKFRKDFNPVVHIQHIAIKPSATFFLPGTKGANIHETVRPLKDEKIIIKHYPNSFKDTELFDYLTTLHISDLVICGMMTHMCVDATVRAAKDFGFNCTVIGDACATRNLLINKQKVKASEVQKSFLAALNDFYATIKDTSDYLNENPSNE